ncbi:hypothetical protein EDD86DRAFT_212404 [Gorgonomyces haynaldii]|nr:hypothetical protein EDD86DRAFT_212404 [Gorgonomyces haynaldii]
MYLVGVQLVTYFLPFQFLLLIQCNYFLYQQFTHKALVVFDEPKPVKMLIVYHRLLLLLLSISVFTRPLAVVLLIFGLKYQQKGWTMGQTIYYLETHLMELMVFSLPPTVCSFHSIGSILLPLWLVLGCKLVPESEHQRVQVFWIFTQLLDQMLIKVQ